MIIKIHKCYLSTILNSVKNQNYFSKSILIKIILGNKLNNLFVLTTNKNEKKYSAGYKILSF